MASKKTSGDWDPKRPGRERKTWNYFKSKRSINHRRRLARRFKRAFPKGHKTSLRPYVLKCAERARAGKQFPKQGYYHGLGDIHPDAFVIIAKYGIDYTAFIWRKPPPWGEPRRRGCFLNAFLLAKANQEYLQTTKKKEKPLLYVEGIVLGALVNPMLHSWNTYGLTGRKAIDWTHYSGCKWSRYIGIPFTVEENTELRKLTHLGSSLHLIFRKRYFTPQAKKRLIQILQKRRRERKKK